MYPLPLSVATHPSKLTEYREYTLKPECDTRQAFNKNTETSARKSPKIAAKFRRDFKYFLWHMRNFKNCFLFLIFCTKIANVIFPCASLQTSKTNLFSREDRTSVFTSGISFTAKLNQSRFDEETVLEAFEDWPDLQNKFNTTKTLREKNWKFFKPRLNDDLTCSHHEKFTIATKFRLFVSYLLGHFERIKHKFYKDFAALLTCQNDDVPSRQDSNHGIRTTFRASRDNSVDAKKFLQKLSQRLSKSRSCISAQSALSKS